MKALDGGGWSTPRPGRFTAGKETPVSILQEAGWAPGPFLMGAKNLAHTGIRSPDRPARSELLYRQRYRGPHNILHIDIFARLSWMKSRSHWPRSLRRVSAAVRLLGLWVRIPPEAWMSVSCEWCVFSGRGLCVGLIT